MSSEQKNSLKINTSVASLTSFLTCVLTLAAVSSKIPTRGEVSEVIKAQSPWVEHKTYVLESIRALESTTRAQETAIGGVREAIGFVRAQNDQILRELSVVRESLQQTQQKE